MKSPVNALFAGFFLTLMIGVGTAWGQQNLPNPILSFTGQEPVKVSGKPFIKYHFAVENRDAYPRDFLAAAPDLPPCGVNTKASRAWIDVFDRGGSRLHGFCAIYDIAGLSDIWFTLDEDATPPSWVYIEISDRKTGTKYKSNLAETTQ